MAIEIKKLNNGNTSVLAGEVYRVSGEATVAQLLAHAQQMLGTVRVYRVTKDTTNIANAKDKRAVIQLKLA